MSPFRGALLFLFVIVSPAVLRAEDVTVTIKPQWPKGFRGSLKVKLMADVVEGWTMTITFSKPVKRVDIWQADVMSTSDDKTVYVVENKHWNTRLRKGRMLKMKFNGYKMKVGEAPPTATVMFERKGEGSGMGF